MQISTLFFTFLGAMVISTALILINFFFAFKSFSGKNIASHILFSFFVMVSYLGAIVTGIIWALQYLKN